MKLKLSVSQVLLLIAFAFVYVSVCQVVFSAPLIGSKACFFKFEGVVCWKILQACSHSTIMDDTFDNNKTKKNTKNNNNNNNNNNINNKKNNNNNTNNNNRKLTLFLHFCCSFFSISVVAFSLSIFCCRTCLVQFQAAAPRERERERDVSERCK